MTRQSIKKRYTQYAIRNANRGAALLVVLLIIMAITIGSLGFLSRSDMELACGQNMILRTQMDYLAESGLEHARGLILNPQDIDLESSEYWVGATAQRLTAEGDDYYDVEVVRDQTDRCTYVIDCNSYRLQDGEKTGRSGVRAQLRLDPCVALWTGGDTTVWSGITIDGDVYCNGALTNNGSIDGDVFADDFSGSITGQHKPTEDVSLLWPRVTVADFTSRYATEPITSGSLSGRTFGPYDPVRVCYRGGSLLLAGNVRIEGMLVVDGDLVVRGNGNIITAAKNVPALLVTGDLFVERDASLQVTGLAVVHGSVFVNGDARNIDILGGLFAQNVLAETTANSSGNAYRGILRGDPLRESSSGRPGRALRFDGEGDYVEIREEAAFDLTNQITVCAWVNINNVDKDWQAVVTKGESSWRLSTYLNENRFHFAVTGPPSYAAVNGDTSVPPDQWHHVCGTYDGGVIRLYVDGVEDANTPYAGGITTNNHRVCIGENLETRGRYWDGLIDDVRVYDHALDPNAVMCVYSGIPDPNHFPMAYWRMDEAGSNAAVTAAPSKTAIVLWSEAGDVEKWGQAAGAFYSSIERK